MSVTREARGHTASRWLRARCAAQHACSYAQLEAERRDVAKGVQQRRFCPSPRVGLATENAREARNSSRNPGSDPSAAQSQGHRCVPAREISQIVVHVSGGPACAPLLASLPSVAPRSRTCACRCTACYSAAATCALLASKGTGKQAVGQRQEEGTAVAELGKPTARRAFLLQRRLALLVVLVHGSVDIRRCVRLWQARPLRWQRHARQSARLHGCPARGLLRSDASQLPWRYRRAHAQRFREARQQCRRGVLE